MLVMDAPESKPRQQRRLKQARVPPKDVVALITAILALTTSILNIYYTFFTNKKQEQEIQELAECAGTVAKITEPLSGGDVADPFYVNGSATPSRTCNYIFVFLRDRSRISWKVIDLVQSDASGKWAAVAQVGDYLLVGVEAEVAIRVSRLPNDYTVGTQLSSPPNRGNPSINTVIVRRTR